MACASSDTIFSIVRLATLTSLDTSDATWNYFGAIVWSTVEQSIGILCVSLPVMGPLMPVWLIGSTGSRDTGSSDYQRHGIKDRRSVSTRATYELQSSDGSSKVFHRGNDGYGDRRYLTQSSSVVDDRLSDEERGIRQTVELHVEHNTGRR